MPKTSSSIQKNVEHKLESRNADLMHPIMEKPIWQVRISQTFVNTEDLEMIHRPYFLCSFIK